MTWLKRLWAWICRYFPFGLLWTTKPRHFREMLKVAWENKDQLPYAWKILTQGVCDGCSLGPKGLRDDVIQGTHLCLTRLKLLRLNTMGPIPDGTWEDIRALRARSNAELHKLGRLPYPLLYRRGARGFQRITWDEATSKIAHALKTTPAERAGFFASSRGLTNEAYYTFQKLARIAGTPHVDSCARLCHAASTSALKASIGWAAGTCSLKDFIGTDLLVLFGTDMANNQPMTMKYLHFAKKAGTQVVVVNPFREPAMDRYWVPSVPSSAIFGTQITDHFFPVAPGGDVAFILGVLKSLGEQNGFDRAFIQEKTVGFDALEQDLKTLAWEDLERDSGLTRKDMEKLATLYKQSKTAVFVWSMGLTQHQHGVDNVKAAVNLALARGNIGRPKTGVMPIRGHSGVQGTAECGVDPEKLPGGVELTPQSAAQLESHWKHAIPHEKGIRAAHFLDQAGRGGVDFLYMLGGNYLETMPDPEAATASLSRIRLRVHQDIVINNSSLIEPADDDGEILLLPAQTRYEQRGGGTSTSTERRIRYTPELSGHAIGEAMAEWEIPAKIGAKLTPNRPDLFGYTNASDVRREMATVMPLYKGIEALEKPGDAVQWGGELLGSDGRFANMPDGRARFFALRLPRVEIPEGHFFLASRRGKQFNSIVFDANDGMTGVRSRQAVFFAATDAQRLSLQSGDRVLLKSTLGKMEAICAIGPCRPGHLQAFWPECNVLVGRRYDPVSGEPDYNAFVQVTRL